MTTILCVDNDPLTPQLLTGVLGEERTDCTVALVADTSGAIASISAIAEIDPVVPLVIANQAVVALPWLEALYRRFPQALTVLLGGSEDSDLIDSIEAQIPPGQLYRCLAKPLSAVDLRLTIAGALRHHRQGQELAQMRADLGAAHRHIADLTDVNLTALDLLALQQLNNELEQRVQQRTQELQKLAAIVENSIDLIGTVSLSGETIYLNQAGRQLLGLSADEIIDQPMVNLHSPAAVAQITQAAMPTALNEGYWRGESILRQVNTGEDIAVEQVIFLIRDPDSREPLCMATVCRDIRDRQRGEADRQQAEIALRESEARFRQITETIQEVFWMNSADSGQVFYVSPAFEQIWGIPREAVYHSVNALAEVIHPEDLPRVQAALQPDGFSHYDQVYRILRPDGETRWIHDRGFPVLDDSGQIYRMVGVAWDITSHKQAELALQESEERFRGTFEQAALGIIEATLDGLIVQVNQKFCELLGYSSSTSTLRRRSLDYCRARPQ